MSALAIQASRRRGSQPKSSKAAPNYWPNSIVVEVISTTGAAAVLAAAVAESSQEGSKVALGLGLGLGLPGAMVVLYAFRRLGFTRSTLQRQPLQQSLFHAPSSELDGHYSEL